MPSLHNEQSKKQHKRGTTRNKGRRKKRRKRQNARAVKIVKKMVARKMELRWQEGQSVGGGGMKTTLWQLQKCPLSSSVPWSLARSLLVSCGQVDKRTTRRVQFEEKDGSTSD